MQTMNAILSAVQRRLWYRRIMQATCCGLLCGAAVALGLVAWSILVDASNLSGPLASLSLLLGAAVGGAVGLSRRPSPHAAAVLIDRYYAMKDRTVTALAFATAADHDALKRLQIADTAAHLQKVAPQDCVQLTLSSATRSLAVVLLCLTTAAVAYSQWLLPNAAAKTALPLAEQQAEMLRSTVVSEIAQLAEQTGREDLKELSDRLRRLTTELKQGAIDQESYFANLSAMEQAIEQTKASLQVAATGKQLRDIATAIKPADAMRSAAAAIEAEDYPQAADELDSIDPETLSDRERRAVADNLKKIEPPKDDAQTNRLAEAAKKLQESLAQQNAKQARQATQQLAKAAEQQGVAEAIEKSMDRQLNRLSDAKGQGRNNGQTPSETARKTNSPSQTWGKAASGNPPDAEPTSLESNRERQRLTGQTGEGASETETVAGTAREQTAQREYAERYQAYRRQAEAVLESEPLPLGQRETIRRYFEGIRPQGSP